MNQDIQLSFRALSDPTRRAILMQLRQDELTIAEVVDKFDLSRTAVVKHLKILQQGDLITVTPRGKERLNKLNPNGLKSVAEWFGYFDQLWDTALNSLKSAIEKDNLRKSRGKRNELDHDQ